MFRVDTKSNGILYAIIFTVVVVSLSVHLTAFVFAYANPKSTFGYLLLSIGIAFLITPACSYFLANYTVKLVEMQDTLAGYTASDALTGCLNRQAFLDAVEIEQKRMSRTGTPAAILLVDLDHFKILNSRYGHSGGDLVLRSIANAVKADIRDSLDYIARWGGEEFVIMLAETSIEDAAIAAHRIRGNIETLEIAHSGDNIRTTVSIGITDLHWAECLKAAIDRTDACLIKAKARGRNRIATTHTTPKPFLMDGTSSGS